MRLVRTNLEPARLTHSEKRFGRDLSGDRLRSRYSWSLQGRCRMMMRTALHRSIAREELVDS